MATVTCAGKLDHVALMVSDLERSFRFYNELLGLQKIDYYEEPNVAGLSEAISLSNVQLKMVIVAAPENPEMTLHLSQLTNPECPTGRPDIHHVPSAHVCFTVTDIQATYESLKSQGVEFVSPPVTWPADKGGWTLCFLYDPDGNLIELVQPAEETED